MLKTFMLAAGLVVCSFSLTGCSEAPSGVVADPAEIEQYNTPEDYDPSSESSS